MPDNLKKVETLDVNTVAKFCEALTLLMNECSKTLIEFRKMLQEYELVISESLIKS